MMNGTHEIDLLSADFENARYLTILSYKKESVAICHSFDLSQHNKINMINLVYNSEIEIYVHKEGQFMYEWIRKKTKILPSSKENASKRNNFIEIYNTTFFLDIEMRSVLHGSSTPETFDDCFKAKGKQLFGNELMQCYLGGNLTGKCLELKYMESVNNITTFLNNHTMCNSPEEVLNIKTSQINHLKPQNIEISREHQSQLFKEDIGLRNKKIGASLNFSSFTRISKVRFPI